MQNECAHDSVDGSFITRLQRGHKREDRRVSNESFMAAVIFSAVGDDLRGGDDWSEGMAEISNDRLVVPSGAKQLLLPLLTQQEVV